MGKGKFWRYRPLLTLIITFEWQCIQIEWHCIQIDGHTFIFVWIVYCAYFNIIKCWCFCTVLLYEWLVVYFERFNLIVLDFAITCHRGLLIINTWYFSTLHSITVSYNIRFRTLGVVFGLIHSQCNAIRWQSERSVAQRGENTVCAMTHELSVSRNIRCGSTRRRRPTSHAGMLQMEITVSRWLSLNKGLLIKHA